jgi:HD-GYP domain-containing protein (c-di-GMP phosphodiesterase class II)
MIQRPGPIDSDGISVVEARAEAPPAGQAFNHRLRQLHQQLIMELTPDVDRVAVALYDPQDDVLKTFFNSTRTGEAISGYEFHLSKSQSLSHLATSRSVRVLDNIPAAVEGNTKHSAWLLKEGYRSSLTIPLFDKGSFIGLLFFDSLKRAAFTESVQRKLSLIASMINMLISSELNLVYSIRASVQVAREFANLRDFETGAHLQRMAHYARLIARELQQSHGLSDEYIEHLYLFAPLHDIGKIGIPDRILLKPGPLDPEEHKLMESHVQKGLEIVEKMVGEFGLEDLPDSAVMKNVVAGHHEKLDGSGYPKGLRGEAIPLEARIIAVADVFDALSSHRHYKQAWSMDAALTELDRMVAAGQFDADCVAAVRRRRDAVEAIRDRFQDG